MNKSELERKLTENGCKFWRHGKKHDIWMNKQGKKFQVWRHLKDIPSGTVNQILKDAGLK